MRRPSHRAQRLLRLLVAVALAAGVGLAPRPVGAAGADAVDAARRQAEAARSEAAAARTRAAQLSSAAARAAADLSAVMVRVDRLNDEIATTEAAIAGARSQEAGLREQVRAHAVAQYKRAGSASLFTELDARSAGTAKIVDAVTERDDRIADEWRNTAEDLAVQEEKLRADQAALAAQQAASEARQREITAQLTQARQALDQAVAAEAAQAAALDAAVRAAEAQRRADEVRRLQAEKAALAARTTARSGSGAGSPGTSAAGGSGGSGGSVGAVRCPIAGPVAFTNDWGQPRSGGRRHQGTDLFSPRGTPNVAVVSGTTTHQSEAVGGLSVYLAGDDGNTYYYTHLSGFAGGERRVGAGETIGYTGNTGNASGGVTHTHFEIRRGGPNGAKVNPYPTLAAAC